MRRIIFSVVMVFLVVTISICHAQPGIGTSHYNPKAVLAISEGGPYVIPVGHIRNVGTTMLNVTLTWTQETGETLDVEVNPRWKLLAVDEGFEPAIIISDLTEEFVGNYSGSVEANCLVYPSTPEAGNPIVASSTLNVHIEVLLQPREPVAQFKILDLTAVNSTVMEGEKYIVDVTVENVGGASGTYVLVAKVDGETVETKEVTLTPSQVEIVRFEVSANVGNHTFNLHGIETSFEVLASDDGVDIPGQRQDDNPNNNLPYLILGIVAVAGVVTTSYFKWFKKKRKAQTKCFGN